MNYKIKVNSEAESKEVQELFFELGFKRAAAWNEKTVSFEPNNIFAKDGILTWLHNDDILFKRHGNKEITIQQLKDLVILKRNDVGDATHENNHNQKLYKAENGWYIYIESHNSWMWNQEELGYKPIELKPIEKPMKEYLVKNENTGAYDLFRKYPDFSGESDIEIPEGAEVAVYYKYSDKVFFWKDAGNTHWGESSRLKLDWYDCSANMFTGLDEFLNEWADQATVIWKRETINDKVASAEMARQESKEWDLGDYDFAESDALIAANIEEDNVNHPSHYIGHPSGIECIEVTRHHDFAIGNAIKYLWRAGLKDSDNEVQDLKKAIWYIQDKINQLESK